MAFTAEEREYETKFLEMKIERLGFDSLTQQEKRYYNVVMHPGGCHVCNSGIMVKQEVGGNEDNLH